MGLGLHVPPGDAVILIRCDATGCGWTDNVTLADAIKWHGKVCPKCGGSEIISDADLAILLSLRVVIESGLATVAPLGSRGDNHIHIETDRRKVTP